MKVSAFASITGLPSFEDGFIPTASIRVNNGIKNKGILSNGIPYVLYRFILYSDGFKQKKSLSDQRSVCGCYIMPAGLPNNCKCSSKSARVITLAAPGQDTNEVLELIVDDIVIGSVNGFTSFDPSGQQVTIFLDAIAIIGDYPAVTSGADLSGHISDSFCSYCAIRKRKGTNSSEILYSSNFHCRRLSLTRCDERMEIIRSEQVNATI